MFVVRESVQVHAPIERLFQLSTNLALVQHTLNMTPAQSNAPGGITSGHVVANSRVVWRGWKFGLPTSHHTLITALIPPHEHLTRIGHHDLTAQAFFQHDHHFSEFSDASTGAPVTELRDEVHFELPFGPLGRIAARLLLMPYVRRLCRERFALLKQLAEGEGWRQFANA